MDYHRFDTYFRGKGRKPNNQLMILHTIAREGRKTKTELTINGKDFSNISRSVDELVRKKLIEKDSQLNKPKKRKSKRPKEIYYRLTSEGIQVVIYDSSEHVKTEKVEPLSSKQFWHALITTFRESNPNEIRPTNSDFATIVELIRYYEELILKVKSVNYLPKFFTDWISWNKGLYSEITDVDLERKQKSADFESYEKIIKYIGYGKPMLLQELTNIANPKVALPVELFHFRDRNYYVKELVEHGIIQKLELEKSEKYELTHLGVLVLLFYLYEEYWGIFIDKKLIPSNENPSLQIKKTNDPDYVKFQKKFKQIRVKYSKLLPDIFNGETYIYLGISDFEIVTLFIQLYFGTVFKIANESNIKYEFVEKYHSLKKLNEVRQSFYHRKLVEFWADFNRKDFEDQNLVERIHSAYFNFIFGSESMYHINLEILEKTFKYYLYSNQIQNSITFDFYNIYKAYCDGWNNEKILNSDSKKRHDQQIKELLNFVIQYSKEFAKESKIELVAV